MWRSQCLRLPDPPCALCSHSRLLSREFGQCPSPTHCCPPEPKRSQWALPECHPTCDVEYPHRREIVTTLGFQLWHGVGGGPALGIFLRPDAYPPKRAGPLLLSTVCKS